MERSLEGSLPSFKSKVNSEFGMLEDHSCLKCTVDASAWSVVGRWLSFEAWVSLTCIFLFSQFSSMAPSRILALSLVLFSLELLLNSEFRLHSSLESQAWSCRCVGGADSVCWAGNSVPSFCTFSQSCKCALALASVPLNWPCGWRTVLFRGRWGQGLLLGDLGKSSQCS